MNTKISTLLILLLTFSLSIIAKPSIDKSTENALLSITSFDKQGKILHQGYGFFISNDGQALSTFDVFKEAFRAEIKDAKGKKWEVTRICGANDLYNIVKFHTSCSSTIALEPAKEKLKKNTVVKLVPYTKIKKAKQLTTHIIEITDNNGIPYYTLDKKVENSFAGCPALNEKGEVAAIVQRNSDKNNPKSYALDISFAQLLETSGLSAAEIALNNIYIPKQLPNDEPQARTYICLLPQNSKDSLSYLTALADYITNYPNKPTGYTQRAIYWASQKQYAKADQDFQNALASVSEKADIHYEMSKLIYRLNIYTDYKKYKDWDMNKAKNEAEEAYNNTPLPLFLLQKADCQFALKQYTDAFTTYQQVNRTNMGTSQTFAAAAVAAEMSKQDSNIILNLLDSAVNRFSKPYPKDAAIYLLQRATHLDKYGKYESAAEDYQTIETLRGSSNLNDNFFYIKELCDTKAHLYTRALADIEKALHLQPNNYDYLVEKALAEWRMGNYDEAIYAGQQALKSNAKGADAYKAIGLAYGEKGKKAEAIKNLTKAKELGDPQAQALINCIK